MSIFSNWTSFISLNSGPFQRNTFEKVVEAVGNYATLTPVIRIVRALRKWIPTNNFISVSKREILHVIGGAPLEKVDVIIFWANRMITPAMDTTDRARIISAVADILPEEREDVLARANRLITPEMDAPTKKKIILCIRQIPFDERDDDALARAMRLSTPEMDATDRARIVTSIRNIPVEKREDVLTRAVQKITPEKSAIARARIIGAMEFSAAYKGRPDNTLKDKAAVTIQKRVRGFLTRRSHLSKNLYPKYSLQCEKAEGNERALMPRAAGGNTTVYLPKEMPEVVLKCSSKKYAIKRFHQMEDARAILNLQNSSHLTIPKASLYKNFLVEERLPINIKHFHNMETYSSQPQLFDQSVRELTRFFSKRFLSDLVHGSKLPIGNIPGAEGVVRYDNLPLYIVEENGKKIGKIGLIDLEHLSHCHSPENLETLARIFPLHLEVIKDEASKLKMKINEASLSFSATQGQIYLQSGFLDHLKWIEQKKEIFTNNPPSQLFQIGLEKTEELTIILEKELLKLNRGVNDLSNRRYPYGYRSKEPSKNFFTENPEQMAKQLAQSILPFIIHNIETEIERLQNARLSSISPNMEITKAMVVEQRSPVVRYKNLYKGFHELLFSDQRIKIQTTRGHFRGVELEVNDIAMQLICVIMEEFVKEGRIFYFDPAHYVDYPENEICWIRY